MKTDQTTPPEPNPEPDHSNVGGCQQDACSRFAAMPEVPLHELPGEPIEKYDGLGCIIPNGALIEVWRIRGDDGLHITFRKPLQDGRQSVLKFGLSKEASLAFHGLLTEKLYPENAQDDSQSPAKNL